MLVIDKIKIFYGNRQALFDLSIAIPPRAAVTLLGRNGMGKTTTVNSIVGNLSPRGGAIFYNAEQINGLPSYKIARRGIALAPEGREIFPNLNVRENLIATAVKQSSWNLDRVLQLFPQLKQRLTHMGNQLSGGEQQMLSIGRALLLNPSLLILDEALAGLAPLVQKKLVQNLKTIKDSGIALLLIDKNVNALSEIADHHYIIEKGALVWSGDTASLRADKNLKKIYLGV